MKRPYIICHMMTALDGKITGPFLYEDETKSMIDAYDRIHEGFHAKAWMCGRKTMEENFTMGAQPVLETVTESIKRTDYIADKEAGVYCISVDPSGKLGWPANSIEPYNGRSEAHIVEILTEKVSDEYLAFLRKMRISYIFGGREVLDFELVTEKIRELLGAELLLLEGGGSLNGSFMNQGLIDELSLMMAPIADGAKDTPTLFEMMSGLPKSSPMKFHLENIERICSDGLWIRYKVNG